MLNSDKQQVKVENSRKHKLAGMVARIVGSKRQLAMIAALMALTLLLAGCTTLPTSKTSYHVSVQSGEENVFDARALVEQAIKTTNESDETQSFWYNGYIKNSIQNRTITSMYEGVVMRPEQAYVVNGRINAQPFVYYRWGDKRYIHHDNIWYRPGGFGDFIANDDVANRDIGDADHSENADSDDLKNSADFGVLSNFGDFSRIAQLSDDGMLPFDPFAGFEDWLPLLEDAKMMPEQAILNKLSNVIEVRINAKEWIERSAPGVFDELKSMLAGADADSDSVGDHDVLSEADITAISAETFNHVLENTTVKMTLWIGKEDHIIYQYQTWIVMPLPGAGYFDQETFFRFLQYDDPSIPTHIRTPDTIEKWVLDYEERFRSGTLQDKVIQ